MQDTEALTNDQGGDLVNTGSDVYEIYSSSSETNAIYKIEIAGSAITRTALFVGDVDVNTKGAWLGNFYVFCGPDSKHIQGMSGEFIGFAQSSVSAGNPVSVNLNNDDAQSGLVSGALYRPNAGALELTVDRTEVYKVQATSDTAVVKV